MTWVPPPIPRTAWLRFLPGEGPKTSCEASSGASLTSEFGGLEGAVFVGFAHPEEGGVRSFAGVRGLEGGVASGVSSKCGVKM